MTDMTDKLCLSCLRIQPLDAFPPLSVAVDGHRSICLTCLGPEEVRAGGRGKAMPQIVISHSLRPGVRLAWHRRGTDEEWRTWAANLLAKPAGWVILDTETTGFGAADIIEIAVISLKGDVLCNTLVRPYLPIPAKVSALTGITEQDVLLAPLFVTVFETRLAQVLASSKLLIYNARFDVSMLQRNIATYCAGRRWEPQEQACLMQAYAAYCGEGHWRSLEAACAEMGVPQTPSHRALEDCLASLALLHAMAG